ncbi:MAG: hypothetical protein H6R18_1919 [Proteobacteria bacterium]|nr:hypothetical protein [Pseudomonadota bacterium]
MQNNFAINNSIQQRKFTKATNTLLGICTGLVADGHINDKEIVFLRTWLAENHDTCTNWPGNMIAKRIDAILADGKVTDNERSELLICLENLCGNHFSETGAVTTEGPSLPLDEDPTIFFRNMTFCFTGMFYFGTRAACERAVLKLEAMPVDRVTSKLDYLVIGSIVNEDWANMTYGRKIETAIERRERYGLPAIVSEQQWVKALEEA